jgi:hypothetical protein
MNHSTDNITITLEDISISDTAQQEFDFGLDAGSGIEAITLSDNTFTITSPQNTTTISNISNVGTNGSYLYTSGSSVDWMSVDPSLQGNTLKVHGDANIEGELTVNGVKLTERLDKIEERLGILHPNPELEEKWENLRGLREAYLQLEKEIIEKEKMWDILKR